MTGIGQYFAIAKLAALLALIGWCIHLNDLKNKWRAQDAGHVAELNRISTAKNEQKVETQERIKVVTRTVHDANGKAKEVETQPLPEQCHGVTPSGVLHADV